MQESVPAMGQEAPDFTLPATMGDAITLSQYRGHKNVVLAFYALDWTGGWSNELSSLQRDLARFEERNAQVLGVSVDSVYSHKAFAESLGGLGYPLLADFHPHGAVTQRYGLWQPDKGHPRRAVFIVDPTGTIRWSRIYPRGVPDNDELLGALDAMRSPLA